MNHFFRQTVSLLSGQAAPFTGDLKNIARARAVYFEFFLSGNGGIILQTPSPFFENGWIDLTRSTGNKVGYNSGLTLSAPVSHVRAISSGVGSFWCSCTVQN
jgi:hypothetical protein